jgi:hypothetical protein
MGKLIRVCIPVFIDEYAVSFFDSLPLERQRNKIADRI